MDKCTRMRMRVRVRPAVALRRLLRRKPVRRVKEAGMDYAAVLIGRAKKLFMRRACDQEIFSSCLLLKNLSVMRQEAPMSTDYLLEQLKDSSFLLRRMYENMIRDYRNGEYEAAFSRMNEEIGSRAAVLFSHILSKMDQVNPAQLVTYMDSFEETFEEERMTQAIRRNNRRSLICTAASMAAVLAVLLNFTAVAVFMNMTEMLQSISMF